MSQRDAVRESLAKIAAHARWYDLTTIGVAPALTQSGEINPGLLVSSYYPSIEVNGAGDLGMTYMQSSATEFLSMYVTGQPNGAPTTRDTMLSPLRVRAR